MSAFARTVLLQGFPPSPRREWWIVRLEGYPDAQFFAELNAFVMREGPEPVSMADRDAVEVFLAGVYP